MVGPRRRAPQRGILGRPPDADRDGRVAGGVGAEPRELEDLLGVLDAVEIGQRVDPLGPRQRRVLGVLIEKAKTVPATYPLTLNAVVLGCNQKNNRDPVMELGAGDVEQVLDELRALGVVTEIQGSGRVAKYRHEAYRWLGVDRPQLAVLAELLLRGEQTLGELRARAERMEPIADLAALKPIVDSLVARGLMIEVTGPGRGQIVSHNLYLEGERAELRGRHPGHRPPEDAPQGSPARGPAESRSLAAPPGVTAAQAADLVAEVAALREAVAGLRDRVRELEARLEAAGG
jgi:uncharacterized protein YceH (UPF0502 family)